MEPVKSVLAMPDSLMTLDDLNEAYPTLLQMGLPVPVSFVVNADLWNSTVYTVYADSMGAVLPKEYYTNAAGALILQELALVMRELLMRADVQEEEAERIVTEALAFDAILARYALSTEETNSVDIFKSIKMNTFAGYSDALDFRGILTKTCAKTPNNVIIANAAFFNNLDEVINEETLPMIRSWMKVFILYEASSYLSEDAEETLFTFTQYLSGQEKISARNSRAYYLANAIYGSVIGEYYGKTYFGAEARAEVTDMVHEIVAVYRNRLTENTWLSNTTKQQAIKKLDNLSIQVGYPEQANQNYALLAPNKNSSLYENYRTFSFMIRMSDFLMVGQRVDRGLWLLPAHTVNAMYNPSANSITFPAAILQAPFYSKDASDSANYGAIGAVIAHEISHAFDPNGAKFDENGSMKDWWTKKDYEAYQVQADRMVQQFDGISYAGGTVNGRLTMSENISDLSAVSCALTIVRGLDNPDYEAFFESWATIWRQKATPELEALYLLVDTHSPNKLRVNVLLPNFDEFHETYGIEEGDEMFRELEDRLSIW
jgi:putative endopeptidase